MNALRAYLLAVAAASLLAGVVLSLLPQGRMHGIVRLVGALIIVLTVVSPVLKLEIDTMPVGSEEIHTDASDIQERALEESELLFSQLIKERCEAYILDKADQMGLELEVQIIMGHDGYPHPIGVKLSGDISSADARSLGAAIEQELGISIQQQEWVDLG